MAVYVRYLQSALQRCGPCTLMFCVYHDYFYFIKDYVYGCEENVRACGTGHNCYYNADVYNYGLYTGKETTDELLQKHYMYAHGRRGTGFEAFCGQVYSADGHEIDWFEPTISQLRRALRAKPGDKVLRARLTKSIKLRRQFIRHKRNAEAGLSCSCADCLVENWNARRNKRSEDEDS